MKSEYQNKIFQCTATVFDKYKSDYVDACSHATTELKQLLINCGINGHVVIGNVTTSFGRIQHCWIVVDDFICDPTVQQTEGKEFFFKQSAEHYLNYDYENAHWVEF